MGNWGHSVFHLDPTKENSVHWRHLTHLENRELDKEGRTESEELERGDCICLLTFRVPLGGVRRITPHSHRGKGISERYRHWPEDSRDGPGRVLSHAVH